MKRARYTLLLLAALIPQCQWSSGNGNSSLLLNSLSVEDKQESVLSLSDSLIKTLPVLPNDYFMTESNIIKEEGYELSSQKVSAILQQERGIIIPTSYDTFIFKRSIGRTRVFLSGKWPVSENVDYYLLKCFTEEGAVEVFIFSVKDDVILASEWIASISDSGIGVNINTDEYFIPEQIMARRQGDTIFIYSFDKHKNLTEEYRSILTKNGELLFARNR